MHLYIADMPMVPLFLFKLSVSLGVVWGFYQLVLRRMTFHRLNRWYLLGYTLISFLIPLINIAPMMAAGPAGEPVVFQFIPAIGSEAHVAAISAATRPGLSPWTELLWVLAAGAAVMLVRFAARWISLVQLRRKARLIGGTGVKVYQVDGPILPFSFGNAIYVNQKLHTEREWEDIILHEYVHVRQRHTIDILIAELVCIVNWYNPFAWLLRYSIRQNLEFIADQEVLDKGADRKGYQYHLLKVVGEPRYRLANNFNFSSLKKRIIMMNKVRCARTHLLKLLFLLPLVTALLAAFRDRSAILFASHGKVYVNAAGLVMSLPDQRPVEGVHVHDEGSGLETKTDERGFYKLSIPVRVNSKLRIHLIFAKDGYDSTFGDTNVPLVKETRGVLIAGALLPEGVRLKAPFMVMPRLWDDPVPADPGFSDALADWRRLWKENENVDRYLQLQKDHPEIGLFYVTEDRRKELVIYMDGAIERYGYSGTPGLDELYKKYGQIDEYMATDHPEGHLVNSGYLARWAAISEQAQKDFHPSNGAARAIIFPGDSRVIVVPVTGKPRFYDMDNEAGNERAEFERLYGKLPGCVPEPGNKPDEGELKNGKIVAIPRVVRDTVPGERSRHTYRLPVIGPDYAGQPVFVINGRRVPADTLQKINADSIASIDVLKDSAALNSPAFKKLGDDVKFGIVIIHMKSEKAPLCLVDGNEVSWDSVKRMNPNEIESMTVLKADSLTSRYGEKGKNGVVLVGLKPKGAGMKK